MAQILESDVGADSDLTARTGQHGPHDVNRLYESLKLPPESDTLPRDAKCIRVLDIHEALESASSSPLKGRLRIVNLAYAAREKFAALSYVWGVASKSRSILCDGFHLSITPNGYSALLDLRKKLGAFTIWVDAVCIDQQNIREKEYQIPLMGEIYSCAAPTYIWLGEGDERSDRAMKLLGKTGILDCFFSDVKTSERRPKPRVWRAIWRLAKPWRHGDKNAIPRSG